MSNTNHILKHLFILHLIDGYAFGLSLYFSNYLMFKVIELVEIMDTFITLNDQLLNHSAFPHSSSVNFNLTKPT